MNSRTKNILIGVLLVGIISMTIVYAALSQQLNISGSAKVQSKSQSWNIHFTHITSGSEVSVPSGDYTVVASNSISLDGTSTTATLPQVTFKAPGDSVTFLIDVINEGDITGYINTISNIVVPDPTGTGLTSQEIAAYKAGILTTFTYADNTAISVNDPIAKTERQHLKITLTLSEALEYSGLPSVEITFTGITASLVYGQDETQSGSGSGSGSVSGGNETPVTPSNPYETTFDGEYTAYLWHDVDAATPSYVEDENGWITSLNPESRAYLRTTGSLPEVCGVFGNGQSGTVCMTSSYYNGSYSGNGYNSDFGDVSEITYDITTIAELQATGLKGYVLAKAEEMLNKGASSCEVSSGSVYCAITSGGNCHIEVSGEVGCNGDDGQLLAVYSYGGTN